MTKIVLDGVDLYVEDNSTIMQVCEKQGIEVSRFCYHKKLSIAGCCRMCLVEVEKNPKPVASCAMPVSEGMIIRTNSELVKKARQNVLELLLINHPLDCPVCDQGGECDLQDITLGYAKGHSRFDLNKRIVKDKNMGPLIKKVMTRCIHCTRCIRFMEEIAGAPEIGALYRGENMEITTYLEDNLHSELSGNLIDICPVGALTHKPNAFHARSWEYKKTESICVMDAVGCNIRVDSRDNQVMRILPNGNEEINECWISDKTRFSYDGLLMQRLDRPYIRVDGKLQESTWNEAFEFIEKNLKDVEPNQFAALTGDLSDCESIYMLKQLMNKIGSPHMDSRPIGLKLNTQERTSYLFNTTIKGIEDSDCILLVATNPRVEAPLINARIRKRFLKGNVEIGSIGAPTNVNYPVIDFGNNIKVLKDLVDQKHAFSSIWMNAKKPMLILGYSALLRRDGEIIQHMCQTLCENAQAFSENWNGYNVLHPSAAAVGALDIGFLPKENGKDTNGILEGCQSGEIKALYLLNVDLYSRQNFGNAFVIYQGHHGDCGAASADVILPGLAYTEKTAHYVNTEGRVQRTNVAVEAPGLAKEDWKIIKALSDRLGVSLDIENISVLNNKLRALHSGFTQIGKCIEQKPKKIVINSTDTLSNLPFSPLIKEFYMTNVITKNSKTMAEIIKSN